MSVRSHIQSVVLVGGATLALFGACHALFAETQERDGIGRFRSDVTINADATLDVREDITLDSRGRYYRYGFVRNLPIGSEDRWDSRYVGEYKKDNGVRVKILEVSRDGVPIDYE